MTADEAREPIRIANCSGFYGDRLSAAREMVEGGPIDVLTGDWLAELTMLILARTRAKRPGGGYARTFVQQMEQVMGTCLDRGIKVVTNAGGLDPDGCAEAVHEVAEKLGLTPTIAYVSGDNLLDRLPELVEAGSITHFETGEPLKRRATSSARTRTWGLGHRRSPRPRRRHRDHRPSHRCRRRAGPCCLAPRLGSRRLGSASWSGCGRPRDRVRRAGHRRQLLVLHRGAGIDAVGFPWAEIAADGSSVIGKHDGTGGEVSVGTITSQLLYEIGGARVSRSRRHGPLRHH